MIELSVDCNWVSKSRRGDDACGPKSFSLYASTHQHTNHCDLKRVESRDQRAQVSGSSSCGGGAPEALARPLSQHLRRGVAPKHYGVQLRSLRLGQLSHIPVLVRRRLGLGSPVAFSSSTFPSTTIL